MNLFVFNSLSHSPPHKVMDIAVFVHNVCFSLRRIYYLNIVYLKSLLLSLTNRYCVISPTCSPYFSACQAPACLFVHLCACVFTCLLRVSLFVDYFAPIESLSLLQTGTFLITHIAENDFVKLYHLWRTDRLCACIYWISVK